YRAGGTGGARACEGSGGAVRPCAPERPGESGVSAGRSRAGEFREAHGQGERADLRGDEAGGSKPHHHVGLMGRGAGGGVFIVVEGPEGAGKSTLVRWRAAPLIADGPPGKAARQPGRPPRAEAAAKAG